MNSSSAEITRQLNIELTPSRIKKWGIKSGLSILDQGLVSGAGFLLNFLLARWLKSEVYGAFAVSFATLLFLSGFHNVLLLEPMSVIGPARYADHASKYFAAQLKLHELIGGILAAALLLTALVMKVSGADHELFTATAASAFALPFFLMLWLVRRMAYMVHRPAIAGWASAGYFFLTLAGLLLLHGRNALSPATAFVVMGFAGLGTSILPLRKLGMLQARTSDQYSWKVIAKENWKYGRWLVLSTALFSVAAQTQTYLVAGLLGLGAAGVFRAMQVPSLVMSQIVIAVGLLVLPSMSHEFGLGQLARLRTKAILSSAFVAGLALAYVGLLALFPAAIERLLYEGKYASDARLIPILGLVPVCTALSMGVSMAVRASQQSHFDLIANAIAAPVGLITSILFVKLWGLEGAAFSLVAGWITYAVVFYWAFGKISVGNVAVSK